MAEARVSATVEPVAAMLAMTAGEPSNLMLKSETSAVVAERVSLKLRRTLVPSVEVAADSNVGAPVSTAPTIELLLIAVPAKVAASLPVASWMALLSLEPDGSL